VNKNTTYLAYAGIIALLIVAVTLLLLIRPDATATLINMALTVLALLSGFAVTTSKLDTIRKQTNGTLSQASEERKAAEARAAAAEAEVAALRAKLDANGSTPKQGPDHRADVAL
jgi:hypothetical protein